MRPLISIVPLGMLGALHGNARHRCAAQYTLRRWAAQVRRAVDAPRLLVDEVPARTKTMAMDVIRSCPTCLARPGLQKLPKRQTLPFLQLLLWLPSPTSAAVVPASSLGEIQKNAGPLLLQAQLLAKEADGAVARDEDAKRAHDANLCACQQLCIATEIALAAPGRPLNCCHLCVAQRFSSRTSVHCVDDVIMVRLSSGSP